MELSFKEIEFGTEEYDRSIDLRYEVLRKPLGLQYDPEVLALEYQDHHLCAYTEDHLLIGVLLMSEKENGNVKMRQFAVKPEYQGQGVGSALVAFAEKWARDRHFHRIELHARFMAVPFYLKQNYMIEGEEFIEVTILHRFMYKDL